MDCSLQVIPWIFNGVFSLTRPCKDNSPFSSSTTVWLGSVSCWNVNHLPIGSKFYSRIWQYSAPSIFFSILKSATEPAAENRIHNSIFLPQCFTVGMVSFGWWAVLAVLQTYGLVFGPNKTFFYVASKPSKYIFTKLTGDHMWFFFQPSHTSHLSGKFVILFSHAYIGYPLS